MMDIETLNYLLSDEGEKLLSEAQEIEGSFLRISTILRRYYPVNAVNAALELIDLRKRAARKFAYASRMFFTREALEQSSGETIARYHANRFARGAIVYDLACGIGGDTIALAQRGEVIAVDSDPIKIEMAKRNLEVYGLSSKVRFICADVNTIDLHADYAFLDPSRRLNGRRVRSLKEMSPSMDFMLKLPQRVPSFGIKLSPASEDEELRSLGAGIEFISESGECKEAIAWFGELDNHSVSAIVLPQGAAIRKSSRGMAPIAQPGRYIYEPDPAVIRSHTVDDLAADIDAWRIDSLMPYLSKNYITQSPFAVAFEIIDSFIFNLKHLNDYLRSNNIGKVVIKKRGIPFEQEDIINKLKLRGSKEVILLITRIAERNWVFVCKRP